jgi:hypothetical protein
MRERKEERYEMDPRERAKAHKRGRLVRDFEKTWQRDFEKRRKIR